MCTNVLLEDTQGKRSIIDVRRDTKCRNVVSKNNGNTITEMVFSECHNSPFAHLPKSNTEDRATASFRKEKQTKTLLLIPTFPFPCSSHSLKFFVRS